jgi:hypothetical protein
MKIGPLGAEFFHADRQSDGKMTKLIVTCRNFANVHKINTKSVRVSCIAAERRVEIFK